MTAGRLAATPLARGGDREPGEILPCDGGGRLSVDSISGRVEVCLDALKRDAPHLAIRRQEGERRRPDRLGRRH
jgi:hypothetical protein